MLFIVQYLFRTSYSGQEDKVRIRLHFNPLKYCNNYTLHYMSRLKITISIFVIGNIYVYRLGY
jgi:hypothetical protein